MLAVGRILFRVKYFIFFVFSIQPALIISIKSEYFWLLTANERFPSFPGILNAVSFQLVRFVPERTHPRSCLDVTHYKFDGLSRFLYL